MPYLRGLDGLRGFAVAVVVVFHSGLEFMSNGFIGVDVFFVLSGFLVTNVLLQEYEKTGTVRLGEFFSRRIKRLLPAAVVTIIVTSMVFYAFGSSVLLEQHLRGARAALLYHANFFQVAEAADYFADGYGESPFEHFWSLSIEEQFYIAFPFAFLGLAKLRPSRYITAGLVFLAIAGVSAYLQVTETDQTAAYLSTFTRVYQILAGVSLAFFTRGRSHAKRPLIGIATLGALLLLSTNLVDISVTNRGLVTVAVVLALLFNMSFPNVLETAALTYLGKISYGVYLWHWPIVVLLKENGISNPAVLLAASAIGGTALAVVSFHTFENGVRYNRSVRALPTIAIGLAVSVAGFAVAGVAHNALDERNREFVGATDAHLERIAGDMSFGIDADSIAPDALAFAEDFDTTIEPGDPVSGAGQLADEASPIQLLAEPTQQTLFSPTEDLPHHQCTLNIERCLAHQGESGVTALVIGDSHVGMSTPIFQAWAARNEYTLYQHSLGGCGWIQGVARNNWTLDKLQRCADIQFVHRPNMIDAIDPDIIVVFSRIYDTHPKPSVIEADGTDSGRSIPEHAVDAIEFYAETAAQVIVIGSLPAEEGETPAVCLSRGDDDCSFPAYEYESNEVSQRAVESSGGSYVDWTEIVCPGGVCEPIINDIVVRPDGHHLTEQMVQHILPSAIDLLEQATR